MSGMGGSRKTSKNKQKQAKTSKNKQKHGLNKQRTSKNKQDAICSQKQKKLLRFEFRPKKHEFRPTFFGFSGFGHL